MSLTSMDHLEEFESCGRFGSYPFSDSNLRFANSLGKPEQSQKHRTTGVFGLPFASPYKLTYNVVATGDQVKRLTYILLATVALHLAGLRLLCAPVVPPSHDCCPPVHKAPSRTPAPVPPCCQISTIPYQASVAQTATASDPASVSATIEEGKPLRPADLASRAAVSLLAHSQGISPPLNPLLQTCLLLI